MDRLQPSRKKWRYSNSEIRSTNLATTVPGTQFPRQLPAPRCPEDEDGQTEVCYLVGRISEQDTSKNGSCSGRIIKWWSGPSNGRNDASGRVHGNPRGPGSGASSDPTPTSVAGSARERRPTPASYFIYLSVQPAREFLSPASLLHSINSNTSLLIWIRN